MSSAWYPSATIRRYRFDGGSMVGGAPKLILHTTETAGVPRYGDPAGANSAPHFTVAADGAVLQHHPINRAARSLRNVRGGVETNRQGMFNVQVEIVARAKAPTLPPAQFAALRRLVSWVRSETGIDATYRAITRGGDCYGASSPCRMTARQWVEFEGLAGHAEVPENTHWDPGGFNFAALLEEDDMLTEHEAATLKALVAILDAKGSNASFAAEAIDLVRAVHTLARTLEA